LARFAGESGSATARLRFLSCLAEGVLKPGSIGSLDLSARKVLAWWSALGAGDGMLAEEMGGMDSPGMDVEFVPDMGGTGDC